MKPGSWVICSSATLLMLFVTLYSKQVTDDLQGVYVCDMGISKLQITMQTITTASRSPKGTYPYMAPDMFTVEGHRGTAADVHSAGCLYIELFGRQRVWPGLNGCK